MPHAFICLQSPFQRHNQKMIRRHAGLAGFQWGRKDSKTEGELSTQSAEVRSRAAASGAAEREKQAESRTLEM